MPREYRHIKQYENEILQLKSEGLTYREIGERLGFEQVKIKKFFETKLYKVFIPRSVRLSEAPSHGKPIQYYDKRSKGADAYDALTKEFIKRNK